MFTGRLIGFSMTVCALIRTLHQEFGFEFIPFLLACHLALVFLFGLYGFFHLRRGIFIRGHRRLDLRLNLIVIPALQLGFLACKKCVQFGRGLLIGLHQQSRGAAGNGFADGG